MSKIGSSRLAHSACIIGTFCFIQTGLAQNDTVPVSHKGVIDGGGMPPKNSEKHSKSTSKHSAGLTVSSTGDMTNSKNINVNGPVHMEAGKSITNGTPSAPASIKASGSVTLNAPIIHNSGTITSGSGNVIINTTNLVNSGSISAPAGSIDVSAPPGGMVSIDNTQGAMTSKSKTMKGGTIKANKFSLEK